MADTIPVKNTDRASRPVDISDGSQIDPGAFGDAPDDEATAELLASGRLTKVLHRSEPSEDDDKKPSTRRAPKES